jgi:hypothetical protein
MGQSEQKIKNLYPAGCSLFFLFCLNFLMIFFAMSALQFSSLEEFQQEFRDINQEEQVQRLHKMLAPHLLRRK